MPETDVGQTSADAAPVRKATRSLSCAICGGEIARGEDYVSAAYGPVHPEPCSHEVKPVA